MGYSQTLRDDILSWFKGSAFPGAPATLYVALLTANPSDETGTGLVEVSTGTWTNYARVAVTTSTGWSAISGTNPRQISNAGAVDFGTAAITGSIPTVTGFALYSAVSGGTFWLWADLTTHKAINNGDPTSFGTGALVINQ